MNLKAAMISASVNSGGIPEREAEKTEVTQQHPPRHDPYRIRYYRTLPYPTLPYHLCLLGPFAPGFFSSTPARPPPSRRGWC